MLSGQAPKINIADTEIVDIVDEKNNVVGSASVAEAHDKKLIHRVVGIFVFDVDGSLYLQTGNKYGKLDLSVGGHVQQGEAYEVAAKREMLEEIGLDVPILQVTTFLPTNARLGHYWGLFTATAPDGWQFKATEEVSSLSKQSEVMSHAGRATLPHFVLKTGSNLVQ